VPSSSSLAYAVAGASSACSSLLSTAQVGSDVAAIPVSPGLADRRARVAHTPDRCRLGSSRFEMTDVVIGTDENLAARE
jgi:hypothetical protein